MSARYARGSGRIDDCFPRHCGPLFGPLERRELLSTVPEVTLLGNFDSGGLAPQALAAGDFNGDGRHDLAVANDGTNTVGILLSGGAANAEPTAANDGYAVNEDGTLQADAAPTGSSSAPATASPTWPAS
ncbi:MAG: FG-GAP repeat protein [Planctomycetota bacterium]